MQLDDLIGTPYKHNGRDTKGFDCWGLVLYIYKEFLSIELPDYKDYNPDWYKKNGDVLKTKLQQFSSLWKSIPLKKLKKYDILIFNHGSCVNNHSGVYTGNDRFIHTYEKTPVLISKLTHKYWKTRLKDIVNVNSS